MNRLPTQTASTRQAHRLPARLRGEVAPVLRVRGRVWGRVWGVAAVLAVATLGSTFGSFASGALAEDGSVGRPLETIIASPEAKNDRAGAPNGNSLVGIKTDAANDVAKRNRLIDRMADQLAASEVDCGQNLALTTKLADTKATLNDIAGRIARATDVKTARAAAAELFPATRVYTVVVPQVEVALACGRLRVQIVRLDARLAAASRLVDANKNAADANGASALVPVAQSALRSVPDLSSISAATAVLLPDRGDAAVASTNDKVITQARAQLKAADAAVDVAAKSVRDLEKATESFRKKRPPSKNK
jgi:hypothetical protein